MALMPKKLTMSLVMPVFMAVAGCSNLSNNSSQKPEESSAFDYRQDEMWLAAQAVKDAELKNALRLQSWSEKVKVTTLSNPVEAKKASKGMISDCALVSKLIKSSKADGIYAAFNAAETIQISLGDKSSGREQRIVDIATEEAKTNLGIALTNCQRQLK